MKVFFDSAFPLHPARVRGWEWTKGRCELQLLTNSLGSTAAAWGALWRLQCCCGPRQHLCWGQLLVGNRSQQPLSLKAQVFFPNDCGSYDLIVGCGRKKKWRIKYSRFHSLFFLSCCPQRPGKSLMLLENTGCWKARESCGIAVGRLMLLSNIEIWYTAR